MMFETFLIWTARVTAVALFLATTVTLIPTGAWPVRLFDFPRLQIVMLLAIPIASVLGHRWLNDAWRTEYLVIAASVVLVAVWQISHILPFTSIWPIELPTGKTEHDVSLMVANIKFDNPAHEEVRKVIEAEDPDLLLLVEIDSKWNEALSKTREAYPHRVEEIRGEGLGMALWSKLPIESSRIEYLVSERRPSVFASIRMPDGNLANFVGVHPTPPGIRDSTEGGRRNSRIRDAELIVVAKKVAESNERPWVVAGDFNDVAWSHSTRLFKRLSGLHDPRVGRCLLNTYHTDYPLLRYPIDQVFLPPESTVRSLHRVRLPGSDHFAVVSEFNVHDAEPKPEASTNDKVEADEIIDQAEEDAEKRDVSSGALKQSKGVE